MRVEQITFFAQQGRLIARYIHSWRGTRNQRLWVTGSMQCHFRGELIAQIGTTSPTPYLRKLLEPAPDQPQD